MNLLLTGSSGLVGSALIPSLSAAGHGVRRLVRTGAGDGPNLASWDPEAGKIEAKAFEGIEGVVHLAGDNIASSRWTEAKKAKIRDSRLRSTQLLANCLADLSKPPKVLVSASAIGYYGDRGEEVLREDSLPGNGYLPSVCESWEEATQAASRRGIRVVLTRIGILLSPAGGALAKMLPFFRMGAGGRLGSGRQFMSWVAIDDTVGAILHALTNESLQGPVNVVAPAPVTNQEFTKTLGKVLSRPTLFPVPAVAARLAFGEMADALLLASTRVEPTRLGESGYRFRYPELEAALRHLLGKKP